MSEPQPPENPPAQAAQVTAASAEPIPGPAETAWNELAKHWDDPEAHRRFIALCQTLGALSYAGGQYRHVCDQHDSREPMARQQIDAVVASAAAQLFAHGEPAPASRAPVFKIVASILWVAALLYTMRLFMDFVRAHP